MEDKELEKQQLETIEKAEAAESAGGESSKTQSLAEYIVSIVFVIISVFMLIVAYNTKFLHPLSKVGISPMTFSKIFLYIMLLCAIIQLVKTSRWLRRNSEKAKTEKLVFFEGKIPGIIAALFLYYVLWRIIGTTLSTLIVFGFCVKYIEPQRPWKEVILFTSLFTIIIIVFFFRIVFNINFYDPPLDELIAFIIRRSM